MESSRVAFKLYGVSSKLLRMLGKGRGLTRERISALMALDESGRLSVKSLAERELVAHSTMSRLVSALTAAGLTAISGRGAVGAADKRSHTLRLTAKGKKTAREEFRGTIAPLAKRIAELPGKDAATLKRAADILDGLLHSLQDATRK